MNIQHLLETNFRKILFEGSAVDFLIQELVNRSSACIGLIGASGSGKTTIAEQLLTKLGKDKACLLKLDDYVYLTNEEMINRGILTRYDWKSRDKEKLLRDMDDLKKGKAVTKPIQNYLDESPSKHEKIIQPCKYIIVEGNLDISDVADINVFLFAPDKILFNRRFERDKDKSIHQDQDKFIDSIKKSLKYYHQILEPCIKFSDVVIDTGNDAIYRTIR